MRWVDNDVEIRLRGCKGDIDKEVWIIILNSGVRKPFGPDQFPPTRLAAGAISGPFVMVWFNP
jgi:hypothetical protein